MGSMIHSFLNGNSKVGALGCKVYISSEKSDIQISAFTRFPTPGLALINTLLNGKFKNFSPNSKLIKKLQDKFSFCFTPMLQYQKI